MRLILVLAFLVISAAPAGAELGMGRFGEVGRHELTDSASAPGVICRFAPPLVWSIGETWLQVRPPMMSARDLTPGYDQQLVGWRAVILAPDRKSGEWTSLTAGEIQRAIATEIYLAPFESRARETQFFLGYGAYRVRMELFWYEGDPGAEKPRVAGRAEYEIEHYAIVVRHRTGMRQVGVSDICRFAP